MRRALDLANYTFAEQNEMVSPQLIYYKPIIEQNILETIAVAGDVERLWPHVKTHKMKEVIALQMAQGINKFKCATIAEAEMTAECGAKSIIISYQLVGPNVARYYALRKAYPNTTFYSIADDTDAVRMLGEAADGTDANVLMDIDLGQHRTGVAIEKAADVYAEWAKLPGIKMCGLHCYDGHRHETDYDERNTKVVASDKEVAALKADLTARGLSCEIAVMGGTPSFPCHAAATKDFLSPGTCVIQDYGYYSDFPELAHLPGAAVITRVVSHPTENTFTTDLGNKAVAADPTGERAVIVGMEYAKTVMQNEEHLVMSVPDEHIKDIPPVGAVLFAVPTHVCPTSALYPSVPVVENGHVVAVWEVAARNRKITF